jgi:hypothetical protein
MCSIILLLRPSHRWPVLIAANRDEMLDRPWDMPARHWPEHPGVIAGRDALGGGTWLGMNRSGVMAAVLNRTGSLGPISGKRSRGELPLLALEAANARAAATSLGRLDAGAYRPFNMVVADAGGGFFIRGLGAGATDIVALGSGVTMVTAHDPNDHSAPRITRYLPQFENAAPPDPDLGDWPAWQALLADRDAPADTSLNVAPHPHGTGCFGTICSSLIALAPGRHIWLFAAGAPDRADFMPVRSL